jgi:DNA polymerase-3 subunit epsilon
MKLSLERPLVFFDIETTGIDISRDRIVQISALKLNPDGSKETKTRLINPGVPIPHQATAVHHITDSDVRAEPKFREVSQSIRDFFHDADIAGFNSNRFDLPLLIEEFGRCGISFPEPDVRLIDVLTIYHKKEPHTLAGAYRFYCDKSLEDAHDAEADVRATLDVFLSQIERYSDIGSSVDALHVYCESDAIVDYAGKLRRNEKGEIVYTFGKHKGKSVLDDPGYAEWMLKNDFPESTKRVLRKLLGGEGL